MKIGVYALSLFGFLKDLFDLQNWNEMLKSIDSSGAEAIELPCLQNTKNCNLDLLLNNDNELNKIGSIYFSVMDK
jgi:hypothetical protein